MLAVRFLKPLRNELFLGQQRADRRGLDVREGWYASHDRLQVHRTARHASIERRRAAAIALLMLTVQHNIRLE